MGIGVGNFLSELRWGGHAVRARGWRAGLIVGMLGVALAASTVIFSAADSFVLGRVPYPNADRLMVLERTSSFSGTDDYLWPASLAEWRKHTDIFSAIHAHDRGRSIYLTVGDVTELVGVQEVTPGLFEALGVSPKWGRLLQPGDEAPDRPPVAIVGEDVARRVFGDPASAVGQWLRAGGESLRIVGAMHAGFRFPTARERIWQPLDLSRWPENSGLRGLFQRAPGVSAEQVAAAVRDRGAAVARVERFRRKEVVQAARWSVPDSMHASG